MLLLVPLPCSIFRAMEKKAASISIKWKDPLKNRLILHGISIIDIKNNPNFTGQGFHLDNLAETPKGGLIFGCSCRSSNKSNSTSKTHALRTEHLFDPISFKTREDEVSVAILNAARPNSWDLQGSSEMNQAFRNFWERGASNFEAPGVGPHHLKMAVWLLVSINSDSEFWKLRPSNALGLLL